MTRTRRLWLITHRYLGLGFGAWFVLLSLTGSVLVFHQELDEWLNPAILTTPQEGARLPLDTTIEAARRTYPDLLGPTAIRLPRTTGSVVRFNFDSSSDSRAATFEVAVDPYTAQVLGKRDAESHFIAIVYSLHYRLLLDQGIGMTLVGIIGILMIISSITGLTLWFPRWPHLTSALTVKWQAGAKRIHFDLHRASGFWSSAVILIVAFTGVVMCFYDYIQAVVGLALPVTPLPAVGSTMARGGDAIALERILAAAKARFPKAVAGFLATPLKRDEPYIVWLRQPGEVRRSLGDTGVWIDQYTGKVLAARDALQVRTGDAFLAWQFPLHNGEAFGLIGRIAVLVAGIMPALLYVSGIFIWWKKRKGRSRATRLKVSRQPQIT